MFWSWHYFRLYFSKIDPLQFNIQMLYFFYSSILVNLCYEWIQKHFLWIQKNVNWSSTVFRINLESLALSTEFFIKKKRPFNSSVVNVMQKWNKSRGVKRMYTFLKDQIINLVGFISRNGVPKNVVYNYHLNGNNGILPMPKM